MPTQTIKSGFPAFSSQEIGLSSVSFQMIFEALQSELIRFDFSLTEVKTPKIPEFNPAIFFLKSGHFESLESSEKVIHPISSSSTSSSELWHFVRDHGHDVSSNCGI